MAHHTSWLDSTGACGVRQNQVMGVLQAEVATCVQ